MPLVGTPKWIRYQTIPKQVHVNAAGHLGRIPRAVMEQLPRNNERLKLARHKGLGRGTFEAAGFVILLRKPGSKSFMERTSAHPLTAPALRPLTNCFWNRRKTATTGTVIRKAAAIVLPQSTVNMVANSDSPIGKVLELSVFVNTDARTNSFQDIRNANNAIDMMPGRATGRTTFLSACMRVQPSMIAASSSSTGMVEK